jgi:hypothetical protein
MHDRLFRWRCWFYDRFPEPRQRIAAAVLAPVSVVCALWILVFAVGSVAAGGTGGVRLTPQIRHAQELTQKLHEDAAFGAVTVLPHIDFPERMRVSGTVKTKTDVEALKARLQELDSKQEYVIEVRGEGDGRKVKGETGRP